MLIHKDIIVRGLFTFIFTGITFWVLAPIFIQFLKKKLPGHYSNDTDLDSMIRSQKERLRSQYGFTGNSQTDQTEKIDTHSIKNSLKNANSIQTSEIKQILNETQWGGGQFLKDIQLEITKNYSYTLAESKINAFILLCEKRDYLRFLNEDNRKSKPAIKNYLTTLLLFYLIAEEAKNKTFYIINNISKKINTTSPDLARALQIKLLMIISSKNELKEEQIYCETLVLNQYSDERIKMAMEQVAKEEANLWAKSHSLFFEELTLVLNYSSMISPLPKLNNNKDLKTAFEILGISRKTKLSEIKKIYKKIALQKHPDKITSQKLPLFLEKKGIEKFNQIQKAYEIIIAQYK